MYVKVGLLGVRYWKEILIGAVALFGLLFFMFLSPQEEEYFGTDGVATVSPLVRQYEPLVRKYAEKYGVGGHVELLLAKMMQESGGRGGDVMQSSESIGLPPNSITDPEQSIDVGVRYFSKILKSAKGDVKLALQSYNFGGGFIPYALERGGYSKENAVAFSKMMAAKLGWPSYGDVNYVDNVMRYYSGATVASGTPNAFGFIKPANGPVTSPFGYRADPFTGLPELHGGIDFGCGGKPIPIYATKGGKVTRAGWQDPSNHRVGYGQRIYIDHGNGVETVYAHLSSMRVVPGMTVQAGQMVGNCGTTGSSTGMHLHFELILNGRKVDPAQYVH